MLLFFWTALIPVISLCGLVVILLDKWKFGKTLSHHFSIIFLSFLQLMALSSLFKTSNSLCVSMCYDALNGFILKI